MEIRCPNLTSPARGEVQFDTGVGKQAQYSCDPGLVLDGDPTRFCQVNGQWSGSEPLCRTQCPDLGDPANGTVVLSGRTPGSSACYACVMGFQPSVMCRTCLASGEWSGTEVTCESEKGGY